MRELKSGEEGVSSFPQVCLLAAATICIAAFALVLSLHAFDDAGTFYLYKEDRWLLLGGVLVLALASWRLRPSAGSFAPSRRLLALSAGAIVPLLYLGHYWILCGYDLSRDEQMAVFDSRIFAAGKLVQPLPLMWQAQSDALNRLYMLAVPHPTAWVSAYLPINGALRALVGLILDPALTGPLLTAVGGFALWKCARLLWPEDREAGLLGMLLYVGSGQVVLAGMTAYAMPAHLTVNLIWLWLFLLDRRRYDITALLVGFIGTGLHQPLFHPMFVAPFLALLLHGRNWPRLALYVLGYAVIGAFWASWPGWMVALAGGGGGTLPSNADYWTRLQLALTTNDSSRFLDMAANLLRFAAWQPILLLPLAVIGMVSARRDRFIRALAVGSVLPILVMLLILPGQGNGFGYRYLHGEIGCFILLALSGWRHLSRERAKLRSLMVRCSIGGLLFLLPLQMSMAHALYAPYARVDRRIAASRTDFFILDQEDAPFAVNLILNRADLSNRPIRVDARELNPDLRIQMCKSNARVGFARSSFFSPIAAYLSWPLQRSAADQDATILAPLFRAAGCKIEVMS